MTSVLQEVLEVNKMPIEALRKKYKELLEQGIISEEEFVEKKAQLFKHN